MRSEPPRARAAAPLPRASCLHIAADLLSSPEHAHLRPDRACRDTVARVARVCASLGARSQRTLRGEEATCGGVVASMASAVDEVGADGLFVLTFSGHTVLKPGPQWCLYDGALELERVAEGLGALPAGARAVVVADTCYAATLARLTDARATVVVLAACGEAQMVLARRESAFVKRLEALVCPGGVRNAACASYAWLDRELGKAAPTVERPRVCTNRPEAWGLRPFE